MISPLASPFHGTSAQVSAQAGRPHSHLVLSALAALALAACAPSGPAARGAAASDIDAVFPAGEDWRVFRLGVLRHARVPGTPGGWAHGDPARAEREWQWLALAAPSGPFRPVQAVPGQRGHFYLVDAASGRLCLYDAAAGLLSTFPLPGEFTPFPAGRAAVFRGADGAFTFLDYGSGEAWQFADRQTTDGGTLRWVPRGRVKLPAGLRDCVQPPGASDLFCRGGDGSALRFDGALNRVPAGDFTRSREETGAIRAFWDAGTAQWMLRGEAPDGSPLFRFRPAERRWDRTGISAPARNAPNPPSAPP